MLERHFGVRAYDYWYGYTIAQIELMTADQPLVVYKNKEKKHTEAQMNDLAEKWAAKKAKEGGGKKEKISLSDYFRNDEILKK